MATFNARAKPYKLKASEGDNITRDDISTWSYTILACARQINDWKQFLPGKAKDIWQAKSDDVTHGLRVTKQQGGETVTDDAATEKLRNDFLDFLTFVATHCPSGFMNMVMRESTSFTWIQKQLHATFDLETRGENFLAGNELKFEFGSGFTYQQALMMTKDFYTNSLLTKTSTFKGKPFPRDEELSPLAENFIVEKCLLKIDPRLPDHIKNTRGHLFTEERPTLACNQKILLSQIDTMLAELDGKDTPNISVGQIRSNRGQFPTASRFPYRGQPQFRGRPPFRPNRSFFNGPRNNFNPRPNFNSQYGRNTGCFKCLEARRFDAAKFHAARDCTFPPLQRQTQGSSGMKVLLVQDNFPNITPSTSQNFATPNTTSVPDQTPATNPYEYDQYMNTYTNNQDVHYDNYGVYEDPYSMNYQTDDQGYFYSNQTPSQGENL